MNNEFKLNDFGVQAANIYFSGTCDLACTYCFQPKIKGHMKSANDEIIKWISSGKMADDVLEIFGPDITDMSFWGGEPSINLEHITPVLEDIYQKFPKLEKFSWSSNFASDRSVTSTKNFVDQVIILNLKYDRHVKIHLQISIDGTPEINDANRIGSSAKRIVSHTTDFIKYLNDDKLRIETVGSPSFKGTQSAESLRWLNTDNNLEKHYRYFDEIRADWESQNLKVCPLGAEVLTFVYPGNYTQEDGHVLSEITSKLLSKEFRNLDWKAKNKPCFETQVSNRVNDIFRFLKSGVIKVDNTELLGHSSCSAGRSCFGLSYDRKLHWCQGTYFFDKETQKYIKENDLVTDFEEKQGFSFRNFDKYINDITVNSVDNKLLLLRSLNITKTYASNLTLKDSYLELIINELASAGQISPCYKEKEWKDLAKMYMLFSAGGCPINNVWEFGSIWIATTAQLKLIFNGAFEQLMTDFKRRF